MKWWQQVFFSLMIICGLCMGLWTIGAKYLWRLTIQSNIGQKTNNVTIYYLTTPTPINQNTVQISLTELYRFINTYRTEHKLSPLEIDQRLVTSAQTKLDIILKEAKFDHFDTNNQPNWSLLTQANYHYQIAGENLAFSGQSAWEVFDTWTKSASHSAQLLKPEYMDMGAALACLGSDVNQNNPGCTVVLHLAKEQ